MSPTSWAVVAALLASAVIPAVSALLAKGKVPRVVAGFLTPLLAVLNGVLTQVLGTNHLNWPDALLTAVASYVVAVAAHQGIWSGTNVEASLLNIGNSGKPAT